MTREEAKELVPIVKAYAEGKTIQYMDRNNNWNDFNNPSFYGDSHYRIKPEYKYRPFETKAECWEEMQKHHPFGWVINTYTDLNYYITCVLDISIAINGTSFIQFNKAFNEYTFIDGTPFGIKEE